MYTAPVGLTADLENSLRAFTAAGPAEVREAGARVGLLPGLSLLIAPCCISGRTAAT
ncbi:MAG: hypothetical protein LAN71_15150 [Acidobacteriia bacterium]|nr:hypothetical protein [Terriglobia bacterium]